MTPERIIRLSLINIDLQPKRPIHLIAFRKLILHFYSTDKIPAQKRNRQDDTITLHRSEGNAGAASGFSNATMKRTMKGKIILFTLCLSLTCGAEQSECQKNS